MYAEPSDIKSSFFKLCHPKDANGFGIGKTIYDVVCRLKPQTIFEFGIDYGYSTICLAHAVRDIGCGHVYSCDTVIRPEVTPNLRRYGAEPHVTLKKLDLWEWLQAPDSFDLLFVDIHNTGDIIRRTAEAVSARVERGAAFLFEGGIPERDRCDWMKGHSAIAPLQRELGFSVLDHRFPGLSIISAAGS